MDGGRPNSACTVLLDGREPLPLGVLDLDESEHASLLRILFPHRPDGEVFAMGLFRGAFTASVREQIFLLGCWRDPAFNGSGAMVEGEVRCGVFEEGRLVAMRKLPTARSVKGFRALDLDGDGRLEVLGHDTYEATGWGESGLWVLGMRGSKLVVWRRFTVTSYSSTDSRMRTSVTCYANGPLHSPSSYRVRRFVWHQLWGSPGEHAPEEMWKEIAPAPGKRSKPPGP